MEKVEIVKRRWDKGQQVIRKAHLSRRVRVRVNPNQNYKKVSCSNLYQKIEF